MLWFLIIGIIAGWSAGKIIEVGVFGLIGDLVGGIVGAFSGGYLFGFYGISGYDTIGEISSAIMWAILLLLFVRLKELPLKSNFNDKTY